jgi:hypothetical protein
MIKKIFAKDIQYLIAFILYLLSVSCQGPLAGEPITFTTPNVYTDLPSEATQIEIKTKTSEWTFLSVQYNDTIVDFLAEKIYKLNQAEIEDASFSYDAKELNNKWVTTITGSFFSIISEQSNNNNEQAVITVDITENRSEEKRVLMVRFLNLDRGNFFRIEQNPK